MRKMVLNMIEMTVSGRQNDGEHQYELEKQIGFVLRRAHQRASAIFAAHFKSVNLSPMQFSALIKIRDEGRVSQNFLGRLISMDPTTIMGIVNRLVDRNLVRRFQDPTDKRRMLLTITSDGLKLLESCETMAFDVTDDTMSDLSAEEQSVLFDLLSRIC